MRTFLVAATGLPTILPTAALVVVVCFWLLSALGMAGVNSFDTDVDLRAWRMSGVPVTVAAACLLAVLVADLPEPRGHRPFCALRLRVDGAGLRDTAIQHAQPIGCSAQ
ncbi:hypothetical protein [Streptomyces bluensis]|uniref:hypothetical protein n=1 Tax=Streptomyces bluensis TaxID=33897 RepID=UPI00331DB819